MILCKSCVIIKLEIEYTMKGRSNKMEDNELKKNYEYYLANKKELLKKYNNKIIIIQDEQVLDVYNTLNEATEKAKELKAGTYIIQKCEKGDDTQIFHTRIRFNV